ncbi:hypothetical protein B0A52_00916 [Exophiala mesophila]|uniref:AB hydrolase-1 domain-containing protein n=1 Tax=Exophiala mesophila TaxID=212818 RepID=A0A438NIL2_EXOME|nr:hypothetical protein B0A52_00916 [Exophiala mesophila]
MFTALKAIYNLQWTPQQKFHPLPPYVERTYVPTPLGDVELLVSQPQTTIITCPPLILVHGGFGHAAVWLEWMNFFHKHYGGTLYAYSIRGHGASYPVPYSTMVRQVSLDDIASEWATIIHFVKHNFRHAVDPVVIAHSAGGALTQFVLLNGMATTAGLCLVASMPHFGGYGATWNWLKADPWMLLRSFCSWGHPSSPLSQPVLVHTGFFGPKFPTGKDDNWQMVKDFMKWMPPYEGMNWVMSINGALWRWFLGRNEWLDVSKILPSIMGWERPGDRVCIMVGSHDRLLDLSMATRQFTEYANAAKHLQDEKTEVSRHSAHLQTQDSPQGVTMERANKIRLVVIQDAGHHIQNDIQNDVAAEACLQWIQQL